MEEYDMDDKHSSEVIAIKDALPEHTSNHILEKYPRFSPGTKSDPFCLYRITKHGVMFLTMIAFGMALLVIGPTMPDLTKRLDVTYGQLSSALVCRSIGTLIGTLIGGYILERFRAKTDVIYGLALLTLGIATALIPIWSYLLTVTIVLIVCGLAEGIVSTATITLLLRLWPINSPAPIHSSSLGFTIGAMIMPQLIKPFLSPDQSRDEHNNVSVSSNGSTECPDAQYHTGLADISRIEIPYMIIGIFLAAAGVMFVGYHLMGIPEGFEKDIVLNVQKQNFKSMINPAVCGGGDIKYGLALLTCVYLYYVLIIGIFSPFNFFFAFAIEAPVHLSKHDATLLLTMLYACDLASRPISIVLAKFVPINLFVIVNVTLILVTSAVMAMFADYVHAVLWTCTAIMGVLLSPLWPNGTAWADEYLQMNSMAVMMMMTGKSCGLFIFMPVVGQLFDVDPRNTMFVLVGCSGMLVVLTAFMNIVVRCHKKRKKTDNGEHGNDVTMTDDEIVSLNS